ncbi:MAG: asparagine--tRNA ligase [SAR324 cluster bacterium]|nr:asparagine--tRNA ligase [SAR324 cluster bacterium]
MSDMRYRIIDLFSEEYLNQNVCIQGWTRTRRDSKGFSFFNINDGSNQQGIQVVVDHSLPNYADLLHATTGSSLEIRGKLVQSQGKGQNHEIQASHVLIVGQASAEEYPLQKKGHTLEFLREIAHLRPRTNTFGCVFRIRNTLSFAIHRFFQEQGFLHVHTPIVTGSDCEGAGEMFRVTTLDLDHLPRTDQGGVDYSRDFFGKEVNLTVSGQLEGEIFATAFSKIYTFGPTFRAENSNTPRHLAEFWMVEPEMAFYDLQDNIGLASEFLKFLAKTCLDKHQDDLAFLQKMYEPDLISTLEHVANSKVESIEYTEAISILEKSGKAFTYPVQWGIDLQTEHERYLSEEHFKSPVAVFNYPKAIKAFYMRQNEDGKTVGAMDILFPRIGEIIGGSQREERLDLILQRMTDAGLKEQDYWWYLDLRKFGTVPHSGFGLGFERFVQFATGMKNIRDVIPFPRVPGNASF